MLDIETQFGGHDTAEVADFHRMLQDVLGIAGAELQLAQELDQLRVEPVHPGVEGGLLAGLPDIYLQFLGNLFDNLLDAPGMDAAVGDEPFQAAPGHLPPYRVKGAQDDRFRGIVDNDVHPGGGFQGADVAAFPADNAPFHLFVGQGHHRDGLLGHIVRSIAFDGQGDDILGLAVGMLLGLGFDALYQAGGVGPDFPLHGRKEIFLGLGGAHTGQLLQAGVLFLHQVLVALVLDLQFLFLPGRQLMLFDQFGLPFIQQRPFLLQVFLLLEDAALQLVEFVAPLVGLLFKVHLHLQKLVFGLEFGLFPEAVGFLAGFIQNLLAQRLQRLLVAVHHVLAIEKPSQKPEAQQNEFNDKMQYGHVNSLMIDYSPANGTSPGQSRDGANSELIYPGEG